MGAAFYIVLESKIDGLDTYLDGKSFTRHIEELDDAARELGVRPLSEFYSADPDTLAEFMEEAGLEEGEMEISPLEHFSPAEGLATVRALAAHPAAQDERVADDLKECERILSAAAERGVNWRFDMDF